ncbi:MAG: hypothetical protein IJ234_01550 [Clostridia bacterium]|nr:hypothetical protein [Clostridia bacterium]
MAINSGSDGNYTVVWNKNNSFFSLYSNEGYGDQDRKWVEHRYALVEDGEGKISSESTIAPLDEFTDEPSASPEPQDTSAIVDTASPSPAPTPIPVALEIYLKGKENAIQLMPSTDQRVISGIYALEIRTSSDIDWTQVNVLVSGVPATIEEIDGSRIVELTVEHHSATEIQVFYQAKPQGTYSLKGYQPIRITNKEEVTEEYRQGSKSADISFTIDDGYLNGNKDVDIRIEEGLEGDFLVPKTLDNMTLIDSGNYSYTLNIPEGVEGIYTFSVRYVTSREYVEPREQLEGIEDASSIHLTVDTKAPQCIGVQINDTEIDNLNEALKAEVYANTKQAELSVTFDEPVELYVNGEKQEGEAKATWNISIDIPQDGAPVRISAKDGFGNETKSPVEIGFDIIDPIGKVTLMDQSSGETLGGELLEGKNDISLHIEGSKGHTPEGSYHFDDEPEETIKPVRSSIGEGWDVFIPLEGVSNARKTLTLTLAGEDTPYTWTIDLEPPEAQVQSITAEEGGKSTYSAQENALTWLSGEALSVTLDNPKGDIERVELNNAPIWVREKGGIEQESSSQIEFTLDAERVNGAESIVFELFDEYNNSSSTKPISVQAFAPAPIEIALEEGEGVAFGGTTPLELNGSAESGWALIAKLGEAEGISIAVDENGEWTQIFEPEQYPEGETTLTLSYENGLGEEKDIDVTVDQTCEIDFPESVTEGDDFIELKTLEDGVTVIVKLNSEVVSRLAEGEAGEVLLTAEGKNKVEITQNAKLGDEYFILAIDQYGNQKTTDEAISVVAKEGDIKDFALTANGNSIVSGAFIQYDGGPIAFTGTPNPEGRLTVEVTKDGAQIEVSEQTGAFALENAEDGEYSVMARLADYQNIHSEPIIFTIDNTKPVVQCASDISDLAAQLELSADEDSKFKVEIDGAPAYESEDFENGAIVSFDWEKDVLWQAKEIAIIAMDRAGNISETKKVAITPTDAYRVWLDTAPERVEQGQMITVTGTLAYRGADRPTVQAQLLSAEDEPLRDSKGGELQPVEVEWGEEAPVDEASIEGMRVDHLQKFSAAFRAEDYPRGEAKVRLIVKEAQELTDRSVQIDLNSGKRTRYIAIIAALGVALIAVLIALAIVSKKISALKDAEIDRRSRASNLTIRQKGGRP